MKYLKIEFATGFSGQGYMEIDQGSALRITDLEGNTVIDLQNKDIEYPPCEYAIIDKNPPLPERAHV
jgi:hypothetical protein